MSYFWGILDQALPLPAVVSAGLEWWKVPMDGSGGNCPAGTVVWEVLQFCCLCYWFSPPLLVQILFLGTLLWVGPWAGLCSHLSQWGYWEGKGVTISAVSTTCFVLIVFPVNRQVPFYIFISAGSITVISKGHKCIWQVLLERKFLQISNKLIWLPNLSVIQEKNFRLKWSSNLYSYQTVKNGV